MNALTVTPQGALILQQDVLDHLGVGVGNTIIIEKLPDGRIELRAAKATADISQTFGILKARRETPLSSEEISQTTSKGWAGDL